MKATEVPKTPPRILIYGDYGTGKTYFIGLLHNMLKQINTKGIRIFDFDLSQTLPNNNFDVDIGSEYGLYIKNGGYDSFLRDFTQYEIDPAGFGGFAIDSLTTLQKVVMDWVHAKFPQVRRPLSFLSAQQDWGVLIEIFNQMMPQLQKISTHSLVVVTAHIRRRPDSTGTMEIPLPAIAGSTLPSSIGLWFTEVWRTFTEGTAHNPKYLIQTGPDSIYRCKTQLANLPPVCKPEEAIEAIKAVMSYSAKNDKQQQQNN